jgi:hypothetical protein
VTGMVVDIGLVSSIWLIELIVEEDPVNRMPFTLSKERNLPEFRSVDDGELAMCHVVPGKGQPSGAPPAHPETPHFPRIPDPERRLQADGPAWRVLDRVTNTLLTGLGGTIGAWNYRIRSPVETTQWNDSIGSSRCRFTSSSSPRTGNRP